MVRNVSRGTLTTKNLGVTNFGTKWMPKFFSPKFSCQFLHEKMLCLVKSSFKTVLPEVFPTPAQKVTPKINTPKLFVVNVIIKITILSSVWSDSRGNNKNKLSSATGLRNQCESTNQICVTANNDNPNGFALKNC